MQKLQESYMFTGMQKDISLSKHPTNFLYNARNIRLTARDGNTLMSITNEKGTIDTTRTISGDYLGHCLLNQYLVVFSKNSTGIAGMQDDIYRFDLSLDNVETQHLFRGNLNFSLEHPIEAIASFENSEIQKIYWTDGLNQPRMINIAGTTANGTYQEWAALKGWNNNFFDFIPELALNESVKVKKVLGGGGEFAPGVIQYAFTYYRKYGQETNIFYTSPLLYISYNDRGASPEDKVDNIFQISIENLDTNFDYLRIYSILRTSINATPFVKRVQDIDIKGLTSTTFTDTGTLGDAIDPTELLYKGGERILAQTLEQKDNTLFMGNLSIIRPTLGNVVREAEGSTPAVTIRDSISLSCGTRSLYSTGNSVSSSYYYSNQLTGYDSAQYLNSKPCAGFKKDNTYRLGVQFQYKTGKWSDPIYLNDKIQEIHADWSYSGNIQTISLPIFKGQLSQECASILIEKGYTKVRGIMVFPEPQDRKVTCQGVVCPTMSIPSRRDTGLTAQSSWFFRVNTALGNRVDINGAVKPVGSGTLPYTNNKTVDGSVANPIYNPMAGDTIRSVEIQGQYDPNNKFEIYKQILTFHTPDVEFDDYLATTDFSGSSYKRVGDSRVYNTLSDIDIQTETPTISNTGSGFEHKSFNGVGMHGIVSGLFYDDYALDDRDGKLEKYTNQRSSCKWMVYLWNKDGSLNNDINRPADMGTASAVLKKKVISNLRFATTSYPTVTGQSGAFTVIPQLFSSNEVTISKLEDNIYMGNVDTMLTPDDADGMYFAIDNSDNGWNDALKREGVKTTFMTPIRWKTFSKKVDEAESEGYWRYNHTASPAEWVDADNAPGEAFIDLVRKKSSVRMKYKSTSHIVCKMPSYDTFTWEDNIMPIVEIQKTTVTPYGNANEDTLREHNWLPCGEPVRLDHLVNNAVPFEYSYGDTYFQRYDCLKTYPFTTEDVNQVVEIGSFMVETYVNIDGRYDRNRGQINNLNMTPRNFNLINPVYSQRDNFFTYKIMPKDFYQITKFPNQITWTKEKQSGADIDIWTNITLASTYDMDGSKGKVVSLNTWKDNIFCFQQKGVSNVLFNSRVQIPVSDGVPIEITNNYKVDGYKYISDGIGCSSQFLIKETPVGIYFVDSVGNHLMHIGDGLTDLTEQCNMTTWFRDNGDSFKKIVYDDINHDVYIVQSGTASLALCYSEKLNQFTGFYDYGGIDLMETNVHRVFTMRSRKLWAMFEGTYCRLFGSNKPWEITFISNGISNNQYGTDKTFTNLECRANVEGEGLPDSEEDLGQFRLPFKTLEVWNEHQHGLAYINSSNGHDAFKHHTTDGVSQLKRKFRIWRCDIPRDNADLSEDIAIGITRFKKHPNNRMRNPWLYIKLSQYEYDPNINMKKVELHDMVVTYFA